MPLRSEASSRVTLNTISPTDERRRTGRYVAGGTALAVTLLGVHHVLLRGASTIAGVCIPAIIMASYIIWVLYSARRDRRKALRLDATMQLTDVISVPSRSDDTICKNTSSVGDFGKNPSSLYDLRETRENPAFSNKDETDYPYSEQSVKAWSSSLMICMQPQYPQILGQIYCIAFFRNNHSNHLLFGQDPRSRLLQNVESKSEEV